MLSGEFEQHHPTDKLTDDQLRSFFVEWTKYLNTMVHQAKDQMQLAQNNQLSSNLPFGQDLDMNTVQGMSADQLDKIAEFGQNLNILNKNNLSDLRDQP